MLKSKRQLGRTEERLAEAQGVKRFDPRMSFQPKTDKENTMVVTNQTIRIFKLYLSTFKNRFWDI